MKIILTQNVENLGSLGDTIDVKPGYGRNYLIPQGFALLATGKASKELRHRLQHLKNLREGEIGIALEQAEKLKTFKLEITRKAGPGGRLFGSVTNRDLNLLLKENNFELNRRAIQMNSPIRDAGTHEFSVRIHSEVVVSMQVQVKAEIDEDSIKNKSEAQQSYEKELEKQNQNFALEENNSEQAAESLQTDKNDVKKDLDKNENLMSQNDVEG